jgi:hypothetical protein
MAQEVPGEYRELAGDRDEGDLPAAARADALVEGMQGPRRAHRGVSGFDEESAGMALALTADVAGAGRPLAGLTNARIQAQVADELVGAGEASDVTDHTCGRARNLALSHFW